ncbi:FAD-dependent oxidoreductase [Actinocrispum wychmicini]|uniref:2-polyprenyl-6-methoxyphenol hydroxylase-like FAD-dependent oxidoreductase n=1 Tax=Actinocrispum wychmicini TaxID=1213861 RepID=A0A4R2JLJ2_9PSEU|nr:NAD(P)/FAD-dependent oxidoreductase [Actinocrispum wychmicini]TCO60911.1 2-polyprenyl-6-methoxyphenol hydroxylase-like FAD-dependent oxidoreductase [Actinocrispum wychmicini]
MRVAVIGAGVGGLCLAQGLVRAGIDVRVYERDPAVDNRYQGFRIGLGGPGLAALRECLPPRLHTVLDASTGQLDGSRRIVDTQLKQTGEMGEMYGGMATDRRVLRHLLLTGMPVEFGKQLTRYDELPDGTVRASFADGTNVTADLLVGADGVNSAVRRQLLPHAELVQAGFGGLLGRTTLTDRFAALVPGFGTAVQGDRVSMLLGKMQFRRPPHLAAVELAPDVALPPTSSYLRWVMMLPPDTDTSDDPREVVLDLIRDWHPILNDLVRDADTVADIGQIRYAKPVDHWGTRPVTLLGDAIHVMPPSGGLGANTAFVDAATLTRELAGGGPLPASVERYEHAMLDHGFAAVQHSLDATPQFVPTRAARR